MGVEVGNGYGGWKWVWRLGMGVEVGNGCEV